MDENSKNPHVRNAVEDEYLSITREINNLRNEIDTHARLLAVKQNDEKLLVEKREALAEFLGFDE